MKAILLSIRPQWCEQIANKKKTIDVRKSKPKLKPPFKCYIYCTEKGKYLYRCRLDKNGLAVPERWNGKIIGEFMCDKISIYPYDRTYGFLISEEEFNMTFLTGNEFCGYGKGKTLYGWHISEVKIYEQPKMLSEFVTPSGTGGISGNHYLYHPPQSWCYVEEI